MEYNILLYYIHNIYFDIYICIIYFILLITMSILRYNILYYKEIIKRAYNATHRHI